MHRFYFQHADFNHKTITINDPNEVHHMKDVLRLKVGDEVYIFNGRNQEAKTVITDIKAGAIEVRVDQVREVSSSGKVKIILACAVPKKAKFELIIEKCTELGVDEIIPLKTKRTEVFYSKEKNPAKQERFQKVAVNAAKQCKRLNIPKIHAMTEFTEVLKNLPEGGLAIIPSLNGNPQHIKQILGASERPLVATVFIGPEGDFTPDEVNLALEHKCLPVSLGDTVLKVDTAAITTVALCRFFLYN